VNKRERERERERVGCTTHTHQLQKHLTDYLSFHSLIHSFEDKNATSGLGIRLLKILQFIETFHFKKAKLFLNNKKNLK
jgi:hypothetical protein